MWVDGISEDQNPKGRTREHDKVDLIKVDINNVELIKVEFIKIKQENGIVSHRQFLIEFFV